MDKFSKNRPGGSGGLLSSSLGGSRKAGGLGRKGGRKGGMGKGKYHHRRQEDYIDERISSSIDPTDGHYRTHLLFPGRKEELEQEHRTRTSPFSMKNMLSLIGKKDARFHKYQENEREIDEFEGSYYFERPEKRGNSYNCDPKPGQHHTNFADNKRLSGSGKSGKNASGHGGHTIKELLAAVGGQAAAAATGGKLTRSSRGTNEGYRDIGRLYRMGPIPKDLNEVTKDCFIIPHDYLGRFLPDGITIPQERRQHPLINVLQVDDPHLCISFQLIPRLVTLNSADQESPDFAPIDLHKTMAEISLEKANELQAKEGFVLKNLEKDAAFPFINYYVIQRPHAEIISIFKSIKSFVIEMFNPMKIGYKSQDQPASVDIFEEVATIARPPVEPISKKPQTDATGYYVCIYKVFKGDDGEKFERNWLFWSGARMLYKNLPKSVGLRRVTLHKTQPDSQQYVNYVLLVECSNFMNHISEAANLLPTLRARICGYTGIYRVCNSF